MCVCVGHRGETGRTRAVASIIAALRNITRPFRDHRLLSRQHNGNGCAVLAAAPLCAKRAEETHSALSLK